MAKSSEIVRGTAQFLRFPLARATGGSGVTSVEVVAVDLDAGDGTTGTGFTYCLRGGGGVVLAAARDLLDQAIIGQSAEAPAALWRRMAATLNRLGRGAHYLAIAAIDLAVWDLHAKQRALPLGIALGGAAGSFPVYGSGGYTPNQAPEDAARQAKAHVEAGFKAVKLRLAGDRSDIARMRAVRDALPPGVDLMVDANEKCDLARAQWLASVCAEFGVLWLEEPLPAGQVEAHLALARTSPVPIASGEHWQGSIEARPFIAGGACAVFQPDLAAMGGITECLRAAQLAEQFGVSVAPHFLPALFVHLAAAAPNVTWLEDFPLLEPLFTTEAATDKAGRMALPATPGHGLAWAEGARDAYAVKA
jgi:L-alanine-DL-glutamate epimerase-like enolase superfamily enzyme